MSNFAPPDPRRKFQNPYRFVEEAEVLAPAATEAETISASRKLLENQYAYLDGDGKFTAHTAGEEAAAVFANAKWGVEPIRISDSEILAKVKEVQALVWKERRDIWGDNGPTDLVDALDPSVGLMVLGYRYQEVEGLGTEAGGRGEIAGDIDRKTKIVRVSMQYPLSVRWFTGAHELAHAAMHTHMRGMHRDKPVDGAGGRRDRVEFEADRFATLYTMPERLIRLRFAAQFGAKKFELNEDTAFALSGGNDDQLMSKCKTMRHLSRLLAGANRYDGRQVVTLADQFHVSVEAMAIRLEELNLVDF